MRVIPLSRMLDLLGEIDAGSVSKIVCFEDSACNIDPAKFDPRPTIAFIDGEHTNLAALSDFEACLRVIADGGVVLMHDAWIIYPAIFEIYDRIKRERPSAVPLLIDGSVFAVFLDPAVIDSDPWLRERYRINKDFIRNLKFKSELRKFVPAPIWQFLKKSKSTVQPVPTDAACSRDR